MPIMSATSSTMRALKADLSSRQECPMHVCRETGATLSAIGGTDSRADFAGQHGMNGATYRSPIISAGLSG